MLHRACTYLSPLYDDPRTLTYPVPYNAHPTLTYPGPLDGPPTITYPL